MIFLYSNKTMSNILQPMLTGSHAVLRLPRYRAAFLLLFLVPVASIPGNSPAFQWRLFGLLDYLLLLLIAAMQALLLTMLLYRFRRGRAATRTLSAHVGLLSGVPAFLFGAKLCPMCIAALLGFLGPNAVLAALEWRSWICAGSVAVLLFALIVTAQSIGVRGAAAVRAR